MKKFFMSIKHFFVGHEITKHKAFSWGGVYYCPSCDKYFEYAFEDWGLSEHEISKESFEKTGAIK